MDAFLAAPAQFQPDSNVQYQAQHCVLSALSERSVQLVTRNVTIIVLESENDASRPYGASCARW